MPSERIARALLRLYPRDWRERYGDEFLALVSQSGLSSHAVVDIVAVATIERVRTLLGLARAEIVPTSPLPQSAPETGRELILTHLGFVALAAGLIFVSALFGVALPPWNVWVWLIISPSLFDMDTRVTRATIGERIALSFVWFLVAAWIGTAGWIVGSGLRRLGAPEPSLGLFLLLSVGPMLAGLVRVLYRFVASELNKPRPEITKREWWAWSAVVFISSTLIGMADPIGRMIWSSIWSWSMWLHTVRTYRVRAARRQELRELRGF
jgi:hypothetical protein